MYYIGISGWTYAGWRGKFYPEDLPQRSELEFASRAFRSIEINGTHYSLQRPHIFQQWYDRTPSGFVFSVKGSRYITHIRRLKDVESPLANFFASGVLILREKLGPFLWQLPPSFRYDRERIEKFLSLLPHTTTGAARMARYHAEGMEDRAWKGRVPRRRLLHCMEIRHQSFMVPEFFELLRKYDTAFVFADTAGKWPYSEDLTSDFVYIRMHGDEELYVSGYSNEALHWWADRIRHWQRGEQPENARLTSPQSKVRKGLRDVFIYFDNDSKVKAPGDARTLRTLLEHRNP